MFVHAPAAPSSAQAPSVGPSVRVPDFDAMHDQLAGKATPGATLKLSLTGGEHEFHMGHIVSLDLAFSSSLKNAFQLDMRQYDRSGRDGMTEEYVIDRPRDAVDPLQDYFGFGGFSAGGLSAMPPTLTQTPVVIRRTLNEWLRFDRPGPYRLYVISHRLTPLPIPKEMVWPVTTVVSNVVTFNILPPDAEWERKALAMSLHPSPQEALVTTPRFLGTDDAVRAILHRMEANAGTDSLDDYFGLIGARNRKLVLAEMMSRIAAPRFPITASFVRCLVKMKTAEYMPLTSQPKFDDRSPKGSKEQAAWGARYSRVQTTLEAQLRDRIRSSLSSRTGRVRAVTLKALIEIGQFASPPMSRKYAFTLTNDLMPVFDSLSFAEQDVTFQTQAWSSIKGREWLPVLKRIANRLETRNDDSAIQLRADVMKRLYELDPAAARAYMIRDMAAPNPRLPFDVLKRLPDATLPNLDGAFRRNLESSDQPALQARLVARYGSKSLLPVVLKAMGDGQMTDSDRYPALLAYVLKWDLQRGRALLRRAVADLARNATLEYADLFGTIGEASWSSSAEQGALEALGNSRGAIVRDACDAVMRYGTASCQPVLWARMAAWNSVWRTRRGKMRDLQHINENACRDDIAIASALLQGSAWALTPADIIRLERLCINKSAVEVCETNRNLVIASQGYRGAIPVWVDLAGNDDMWDENTWRIGQYTLSTTTGAMRKVCQYSRGTKFVVIPGALPQTAAAKRDLSQFLRAAKSAGMDMESL